MLGQLAPGGIGGATGLIKVALGVALLLTAVAIIFRKQIQDFALRHSEGRENPPHRHPDGDHRRRARRAGVDLVGGRRRPRRQRAVLPLPHLPTLRIIGSDIAHAVPLTLVAGIGHWLLGSVDWSLLGSLLIGSLPGIWLGSHISTRVPDRVLRPILAGMLVLVGSKLICGLNAPNDNKAFKRRPARPENQQEPSMYRYDPYDQQIVDERVAQFRDQTRRYLAGELTDEEFRPCACRTACTSSATRRCCGSPCPTACCRRTRCASWPHRRTLTTAATPTHHAPERAVQLARSSKVVPEILAELATVQMHAIQTSGNLHPQHHLRPLRRRRRRRIPRPAPLVRDPAPVEHLPPRVRLSCRASSRSPSMAPPKDRAVIQCHDIGLAAPSSATRR